MTGDTDWFRDPIMLLAELRRAGVAPSQPPAIAGYEDVSEIRRGGQGVVYSAHQRSTKRRVAIKVLYEDAFASPARRRRFEREIELVASLQHPHIVRVYDSGTTADGRLYFVMEHIEGSPLDEWLSMPADVTQPPTATRPVRGLLGLFAIICDAVGFAHLKGVIHRDLKPSNILMDARGDPHIVDFGIARLADAGRGGAPTVTAAGHFLGTLAYASPEQVRGDPAAIDIRSDVYSLGAVLYEMLTGSSPHPSLVSVAELVDAITDQMPAPPSALHRRFRDDARIPVPTGRVDHEIDTIVLKALDKNPERRYPSAEALGRDVRRYLAGQPIDAKRDSGWYVFSKTIRRHKLRAAGAAAFVVLIFGFGITASILLRRTRIEAAKANQIRVFLEDTLGSVDASPGGGEVTLRSVLDEAVHWVQIALADQPEVEAALRTTIGNSYRSLGLYDVAEGQLHLALDVHRRLFGDTHPAVAQSLNALAHVHRDRGDLARADEFARRSLAIRRDTLGPDHPDVATSLQNVAAITQAGGRLADAEAPLRESLAIRRGLYGDEHVDTAMSVFKLAENLRAQGRWSESEVLHRGVLAVRQRLLHVEHPDLARSSLALSAVLIESGKAAEAGPIVTEDKK